MKEAKDIERAEENLLDLQSKPKDLNKRLKEETEEIKTSIEPSTEELKTFVVIPEKRDISVSLVGPTFTPYWIGETGGMTPAW